VSGYFIEHTEGKPATVSWELLGEGAKLAKTLGVELCSIVIGEKVNTLQESFCVWRIQSFLIDAPVFHHYRTETFFQGNMLPGGKVKPEILLMGATGMGRDLAGAVATKLNTGLTAGLYRA